MKKEKTYLYMCPKCGNISAFYNEDTSVLYGDKSCIKCETILNVNNKLPEFETIFINKPTSRIR
jgi:predicted RNA-binding Zn-ribbon protein involved in translation (DUF1610 family)